MNAVIKVYIISTIGQCCVCLLSCSIVSVAYTNVTTVKDFNHKNPQRTLIQNIYNKASMFKVTVIFLSDVMECIMVI